MEHGNLNTLTCSPRLGFTWNESTVSRKKERSRIRAVQINISRDLWDIKGIR